MRWCDSDKIFGPQNHLPGFANTVFPPFLAAILNFYTECKNIYFGNSARKSDFDKILAHGVYAESCGSFYPKSFSLHFWQPFLNFWVKRKNLIILKTVQDGYMQSSVTFAKNDFLAIFGGHLEFLCKVHLSWKDCEIERFWPSFSSEGCWKSLPIFQESIFPQFFAANLSFCITGKMHLSETESLLLIGDALFLLCKNCSSFSCEAIL